MTKDSLTALLLNYLKENISSLSMEDRFLIDILTRHLITLILPDRNQDISEQLPEIISNAVESFVTTKDSDVVKLREGFELILRRKISIEEDRDEIVLLLKRITESKTLTT